MPKKDDEGGDILISQGAKRSIHTASDDISKALSGESASIVSTAIEHAKEQEELEKEKTLASNKNKAWFGLAILLLVISTGFIVWGILTKERNITIEPIVAYQGIITYDKTEFMGNFESKSSLLVQKFKDAETEVKAPGLVRFRFKNIDPVSTTNLITAFGWRPGVRFSAGLDNNFDFGVYRTKITTKDAEVEKNYPFILFKTNGSDQSFSGFSLWEDNILFDIGEIFGIGAQTALDPIYQKKFQNVTIESHDGRILYDSNNNPLIIMIFLDENHALITNSKEAVAEILKRVLLKK